MERRRARGFTLIEIVIVIAVMGIIAALAVPALQGLVDDQRVKGAARATADFLLLGRSEAIRTGRNHLVCFRTQQNNAPLSNVTGPTAIANLIQDDDGTGPLPPPDGVIDAGERVLDLQAQTGLNWGVTFAAGPAPLDPDPAAQFGTGVTFRTQAGGNATCVAFAPDGTPRSFSVAPFAMGAVGSGAGGIYVTNGRRDFAVVLSPLGGVRVHAWNRGANAWRN